MAQAGMGLPRVVLVRLTWAVVRLPEDWAWSPQVWVPMPQVWVPQVSARLQQAASPLPGEAVLLT